MNKTVLIFTVTALIFGGVLGFFTAGRVAKHRIEKLRDMSHDPQSEKEHLAKRLDLSTEQKDEIFPIFDQHIPTQRAVMKKHRKEMDSLRTVMFKEMQPILTEDQLAKLARMKKRAKRKRRHHPPSS